MESKEMTATRKESVIGLVSNCANLRVRKEPDDKAEVLGTIPVDTEVMIEEDEPSSEFYKVFTASGLEGFCMKQFITV
ncbi:SH3 domain-containing protein [Cuneatibacter caecimuris]|uniref:SH3 domain-containing protein n=1 Tax=Cuneatibacter caecimuris TaxID=1796618 RepID=A0A4Q7P430_9FIRM|nr:SH3 domain-containing protein [Cuneatibacter caecimuris]RZS94198.1 SH3 domain-containing protein [Cuneatibacter caecimuris]